MSLVGCLRLLQVWQWLSFQSLSACCFCGGRDEEEPKEVEVQRDRSSAVEGFGRCARSNHASSAPGAAGVGGDKSDHDASEVEALSLARRKRVAFRSHGALVEVVRYEVPDLGELP